jgi:WD40 repeat protein
MTIEPPSGVKLNHLTPVETETTSDGLLFIIDWEYTKDNAKDGDYTVTMETSYDGNNTVTNTSTFKMTIPKAAVTDLSNTPKGPLIILGALVGVGVVAVVVYINRKRIFRPKTSTKGKQTKKQEKKKSDEDQD